MTDELDVSEVAAVVGRVRDAVETVIEGKREQITLALTVMLAEGHLLLEDVPGVGKTMLAKALARAVDVSMHRIQFTPDLIPSDILGVSIFNQQTQDFEFKPGGIFANIVVGDEINRASPKTQSAMLEAMEEGHVSVDGATHELARPFMVVATQNPIEMEGTYPMPEAQRDRFMAKIAMGYPARTSELRMLDSHGSRDPLAAVAPVTDGATIERLIGVCREVYVAPSLREYLVSVVGATRDTEALRLGASPRASLHLLRAARASAAIQGRSYVNPEDIRDLAIPVLAHRVMPSAQAQLSRQTPADIVRVALDSVKVPGDR